MPGNYLWFKPGKENLSYGPQSAEDGIKQKMESKLKSLEVRLVPGTHRQVKEM